MAISSVSKELKSYPKKLSKTTPWAALSTAAATFLTITALTIIIGCCLLLVFSNISASKIILFGITPGIIILCLAIPPAVITFILQRRITRIRNKWLTKCEGTINDPANGFYFLPPKEKIEFLNKNFLKKEWKKDYKERLFSDLKDRLPKEKERDPKQKILGKTLDAAKKALHQEDNKDKKKKVKKP